ncbi:hypothetical protein WMY93_016533 [Mugilogobius chulae]|uniref:Uncharacterized protein n=1 Tax=Mugilogobius chulae TaxID=88201 RepID=A0AAW0NXD5_9GOBI
MREGGQAGRGERIEEAGEKSEKEMEEGGRQGETHQKTLEGLGQNPSRRAGKGALDERGALFEVSCLTQFSLPWTSAPWPIVQQASPRFASPADTKELKQLHTHTGTPSTN